MVGGLWLLCEFGEGRHDFADLAGEKKCALCVLLR